MYKSFDKIVVYPTTGTKRKEAVKEAREFAYEIEKIVTLDFNEARIKINGTDPQSLRVLDAKLLDELDKAKDNSCLNESTKGR